MIQSEERETAYDDVARKLACALLRAKDAEQERDALRIDLEDVREDLLRARGRLELLRGCGQEGPVCAAPAPGCIDHQLDFASVLVIERDAALARAEKAERERDEEAAFARAETEHANRWSRRAHAASINAERLVEALRECGKCRVCDGSGLCSKHGDDPCDQPCDECDGTGTDPVARTALAAHEEGT